MARLKAIYEQRKQQSGNKGGSWFWTPPEGKSQIRILPSSDEDQFFYKATGIHRIDDQNVYCPKLTTGAPCPICETVSKLWASKRPEDITLAKKLKARKKFYSNVIVRKLDSDGEVVESDGPYIWTFGVKMLDKLLNYIFDKDFGDLTSLKNGWDFVVEKGEKDGFPNYDNSKPRVHSTPAGSSDEIADWLERAHDVYGFVDNNVKSYKEIQAVLLQEDDIDDDTTDDEPEDETDNTSKKVDKSILDELNDL